MVVDIKPGKARNRINLKSRRSIPVAILTTASFDATTVDPLSLKFGPGAGTYTARDILWTQTVIVS